MAAATLRGGMYRPLRMRSGRYGSMADKSKLAWRPWPPRPIYRPLRYVAADIFFHDHRRKEIQRVGQALLADFFLVFTAHIFAFLY